MKRSQKLHMFSALFSLLFSVVGVDFIFQGVEMGLMKKMHLSGLRKPCGAITGISMILVSMVVDVPVYRGIINTVFKPIYLLIRITQKTICYGSVFRFFCCFIIHLLWIIKWYDVRCTIDLYTSLDEMLVHYSMRFLIYNPL